MKERLRYKRRGEEEEGLFLAKENAKIEAAKREEAWVRSTAIREYSKKMSSAYVHKRKVLWLTRVLRRHGGQGFIDRLVLPFENGQGIDNPYATIGAESDVPDDEESEHEEELPPEKKT